MTRGRVLAAPGAALPFPVTECGRGRSNDNGATWLPDDTFSNVVTPLPAQPDPGIQPTYAGDHDYGSAVATKHVTSWTDGRVAINAASQQDAFTDREPVGTPTPTPTASPSTTPTATATATPTPATPTATATATATAMATATPRLDLCPPRDKGRAEGRVRLRRLARKV
jgi:hypothetical protein